MYGSVRAALVASIVGCTLVTPLAAQRTTLSSPLFGKVTARQYATLGMPVVVTVSATAPTAVVRLAISGVGVDSIEVRSRLLLADDTPYTMRLRDASGSTTRMVAISAPNDSGRGDRMGRIRSDVASLSGAPRATNLVLRLASPRSPGHRRAVTCEISAVRVDM